MACVLVVLGCVRAASGQNAVVVVNGASFRAEQPVAAGSWVSGFGSFANVGEVQAASLPLPKELGGVRVRVGGVAAGINYVSATQINFLIPYQLAPGLHAVVVEGPAGTYNGTVRIISAAPGIFLKDQGHPPRGAIQNQDFSENGPERPAIRGQAIVIYATGPGALSANIDESAAAPQDPLIRTISTPQVFVGGVPAEVTFSGLAPGFAGLWQINGVVPNLSFLSGQLPVRLFMNGVDSNEVSVYVAP